MKFLFVPVGYSSNGFINTFLEDSGIHDITQGRNNPRYDCFIISSPSSMNVEVNSRVKNVEIVLSSVLFLP
jgi:hypothetical protein